MGRAIGLDHLTVLDVAPPDFVSLAAKSGFTSVGLRVSPVTPGEQAWPVYPGSPMLAETVLRCADTGVAVHAVEAIALGPESDLAGCDRVIETAAALGARYLNVICDDPDTGRFTDLLAALTRLARGYGVRPVIEFTAYRPISTLAAAIAVARRSEGCGLLLDALHIQRCGVAPSDLAGTDPALLSYFQVCDAPLRQPRGLKVPAAMARGQRFDPGDDAVVESRAARLLPGEGELPLAELLGAVPPGMLIAAEAPSAAAVAAFGPDEYVARAGRALRSLVG